MSNTTDSLTALIVRLERERDAALADRDLALSQLAKVDSSGMAKRIGRKIRRLRERVLKRTHRGLADGGSASTDAVYVNRPTPFRVPANAPAPVRIANPDVTVVIPIYNSEDWLDDCISSVLAQQAVALELICVNDGSTDGSRDLLQKHADADPRVVIIDQPNQGQSVGRNAGLEAAAGRYLIYLDSDDFWPADTLSTLVARADGQQLDVLMFDCFAFLDGGIAEATWKRYSTYYQRSYEYADVRTGATMISDMRAARDYRPHVGMYLARTEFVRQAGVRFIPGIVHQDNPYTFALLIRAKRVAHTGAEVYARRMRPGSTITTLNAARSVKGYFLSYVAMVREIQAHEYSPYVSQKLGEVIEGVFAGAAKNMPALTPHEFTEISSLDRAMDAQLVIERLRAARSR